jgi:hypothetical protein
VLADCSWSISQQIASWLHDRFSQALKAAETPCRDRVAESWAVPVPLSEHIGADIWQFDAASRQKAVHQSFSLFIK